MSVVFLDVPPFAVPEAILVSEFGFGAVFGDGVWETGLFLFPSLHVEDIMPSSPQPYGQTLSVISSSTSYGDDIGCNLRASFRSSASRLSSS